MSQPCYFIVKITGPAPAAISSEESTPTYDAKTHAGSVTRHALDAKAADLNFLRVEPLTHHERNDK